MRALAELAISVVLLWRCVARADEAPELGQPAKRAGPARTRRRGARSILDQELSELAEISKLYQQQLELLEDLQRGLRSGLGRHLPKPNVQALLEKVPNVSEQVALGTPPARFEEDEEEEETRETPSVAGGTTTAAAVEDFLISKAVVPQESPATHLGLMPLRNHRSSAPTPATQVAMPTVLLVAVQEDGDVCLYTVSGDLAMIFPSGHKQAIAQLAVSPMQDEYVVATVDTGGMLRVHKILVRPRRNPQEQRRRVTNPEEEKVSSHLGSPSNITVQFHLATRVPLQADNSSNASIQLTAFIMTAMQGVKYFLTGDSVGWISVFTRNGTLHQRHRVSEGGPVTGINSHLGSIVWVAGGQWGLMDLDRGMARTFACFKYPAIGVQHAVTDSTSQSRIIAADEDGSVWVFALREKRDCKVEHRFPHASHGALSAVRGFVMAVEKSRTGKSEMVAFNLSHSGKSWEDPARDSSPIAWRRSGRPLRDWALQRRYQEGDLLVTLSEDGMEIEIFELMMQVYQPPPGDMLGNFKMPIFAAAMILVMGYQFVKQKGPFEPSESDS